MAVKGKIKRVKGSRGQIMKAKEVRDVRMVKLIMEAAQLRDQRKAIKTAEEKLKAKIKEAMRADGVEIWTTLAGHRALLTIGPGRITWLQKNLAEDLGISVAELEKYKRRGDDIYSLTVESPK